MASLLDKNWVLPEGEEGKSLLERLLARREVQDVDEFFRPSWERYLGKFGEMPGVEAARARILEGIEKGEKMRIFGDYDADGVCATAILYLALQEAGAEVDYRLPHRVENGYGLTDQVIEEASADGINLLLTVDCGITNVAEVALAAEKGLDVIVTDHHAITTDLPEACALVNPRLNGGEEVVGATVAFRLAEAVLTELLGEKEADKWLRWQTDLVAIATVADCAPLQGENRALVHFGLKGLPKIAQKKAGMRVLCELANVNPEECKGEDLGFRIAPRINAAGRVAHPEEALRLLLAENAREAREAAENLQKMNNDRQKLTRNAVESAIAALGDDIEVNTLIMHKSPEFHPGIIGLVAGRLCERHGKPTIICEEREGLVIGSCRSVPEFHMAQALSENADLFERFGGHAGAAGFTARASKFEEIFARLEERAQKELAGLDLRPKMILETTLEPRDLHLKTWKELQAFEPFGLGNPEPVFHIAEAQIVEARKVGSTSAHLKLKVQVGSLVLGAIWFGGGEFSKQLPVGAQVELACALQKHVWNGWADLELVIYDAKIK